MIVRARPGWFVPISNAVLVVVPWVTLANVTGHPWAGWFGIVCGIATIMTVRAYGTTATYRGRVEAITTEGVDRERLH